MTARIIDGKQIADQVLEELAARVAQLKAARGVTPGLAAVLVGDDAAAQLYVRNKSRACARAGVFTEAVNMPAASTTAQVVARVRKLNRDARFHGILVQLPLPECIDEAAAVEAIDPCKDVDGLHPASAGRLAQGQPAYVPATPLGIQQLLLRSGFDPDGKHVVICGRSNIVSKPLAMLLVQKGVGANATVTMAHTHTHDIASITRTADILVVATGQAQWLKADMVKPGAVVIDVGTNRVADPNVRSGWRLVGDVDFEGVCHKAAAITPVPGGVGPMTVAMLVANTVKAAEQATGL